MKTTTHIAILTALVSTLAQVVSAQLQPEDFGLHPQDNADSGFLQKRQVYLDVSYGGILGGDKVKVDSYKSFGLQAGVLVPFNDHVSFDVAAGYSKTDYKKGIAGVGANYPYVGELVYWFYEENKITSSAFSIGSTLYFSFLPNEQNNPFLFFGGSFSKVDAEDKYEGVLGYNFFTYADGRYYSGSVSDSWNEYGVYAGAGIEFRADKLSIIPSVSASKSVVDDDAVDGIGINANLLAIYRFSDSLALRLKAGYGKNTKADHDGGYSLGCGMAFAF